jgi:hypothetical protein
MPDKGPGSRGGGKKPKGGKAAKKQGAAISMCSAATPELREREAWLRERATRPCRCRSSSTTCSGRSAA